jgi:hypothetical protein
VINTKASVNLVSVLLRRAAEELIAAGIIEPSKGPVKPPAVVEAEIELKPLKKEIVVEPEVLVIRQAGKEPKA